MRFVDAWAEIGAACSKIVTPMPLYAFYPQPQTGSASLFETRELDCDEAAAARAQAVLDDHPDAVAVSVWEALRFVCHVERPEAPPVIQSKAERRGDYRLGLVEASGP